MRRLRAISVLPLAAVLTLGAIHAASVNEIVIQSAKMEKAIPATLILPDNYKDGSQHFPVLYLLHGTAAADCDRRS
jgi:hypothetical protein